MILAFGYPDYSKHACIVNIKKHKYVILRTKRDAPPILAGGIALWRVTVPEPIFDEVVLQGP